MGCWCETCGVTQLPINHGDKIRLFVLINQEHEIEGSGTSYINEIWAPFGMPVKGTYDDYGNVENIVKCTDNKILLQTIKEGLIPITNKFEKFPPINEASLEEVLYLIERNNARFKLGTRTETHLGLMMVLEEFYQTMIKFDPIVAAHHEHGWLYKPYSETIKEETKKWYNDSLKSYQVMAKSSNDDYKKIAETMLVLSGDLHRIFYDFRSRGLRVYKDELISQIKKGAKFETRKVQELCNSVLEMTMFDRAMSYARKFWAPQTGKGSQQNELDIYKTLNKVSNSIITAREEKDIKDGCEIPDAEGYCKYMREHNEKELNKHEQKSKQVSTKKTG